MFQLLVITFRGRVNTYILPFLPQPNKYDVCRAPTLFVLVFLLQHTYFSRAILRNFLSQVYHKSCSYLIIGSGIVWSCQMLRYKTGHRVIEKCCVLKIFYNICERYNCTSRMQVNCKNNNNIKLTLPQAYLSGHNFL